MRIPKYLLLYILALLLISVHTASASAPDPTPTPGLLGHWMLDEGSGDLAADSSGQNNHGTLQNSPPWTAGQFGQALEFDGTSGGVVVPSAGSLNNLDQFSIALWFFANSAGLDGFGNFAVKDDTFKLRFSHSTNRIYLTASRWTDENGQWRFFTVDLDDFSGAWHHLVVTYDYSSLENDPRMFLDGLELLREEMTTPAGVLGASQDNLIIGNRASLTSAFDGTLDEVRLFNRELSAEEALHLAAAPADATPPGDQLNLNANAIGQTVALSWDAASDPESGIFRYQVYRDTVPGGQKELIASVPATDLTFTDILTYPDQTYYYQVAAVNNTLLEGNRSNEASDTTIDAPPNPPARPDPRSVGDEKLSIQWDSNSEVDIAGYNIYRSLTPGGPYTKLNGTLLTGASFDDNGLTNGVDYHYVVSAVDTASQESEFSAELSVAPTSNIVFAVIGDYGDANKSATPQVAALVQSFNPDFVVTTGDNNYPDGLASTIDPNIGQFYGDFIYPYQGTYGDGADINRFFPALGNHDYYTPGAQPYMDYFKLPGNERYYDFIWGPVHFFILNTDVTEPDGGLDPNGIQGQWLQNGLSTSTAPFQFVVTPTPPYSSGKHGSKPEMRWPFLEWGADAVLQGNDHIYERLIVDGLHYFTSGLGGRSLYSFSEDAPGTVFKYNEEYGAIIVEANRTEATFKFVNVQGDVVDLDTIGSGAPADNTPPTAPTGLTATAGLDGIDLNWNAATDPESGISYHNIYRSTQSGTGQTLLGTVSGAVFSFLDLPSLPGVTYYYSVSAVNGVGLEGDLSNEDSAAWTLPEPDAPTGLTATGLAGAIDLDWDDNSGLNLGGYNIFRSVDSGGPYQLLDSGGLVGDSSYIDSDVDSGVTYFYVVTAEDILGQESPQSNEASAAPLDPPDPPEPGGDGPVALWKFDEGWGNLAADSSGNGHDGTLINAPTWVEGPVGHALEFQRLLGQSVLVNDAPGLNFGSNSFSLTAWVRFYSAVDSDIIRKGSTDTADDWYKLEIVNAEQNFQFNINTSVDTSTSVKSPGSYGDGLWHHVVGIRDVAQGQILLYVDGALVNTKLDPTGTISNNANLTVGSKDTLNDDFMNGGLDEVAIYPWALTQQEVQDLFNDPGAGSSNNAPTAGDDSFSVSEDEILSVAAVDGVLTNDSDPDNDPLTASVVAGASHGALTLNSDGSLAYTPDPDYSGPDSFTYQANDGQADSNVATVDLSVLPVNDPPVADDLPLTTDQDTPATIGLTGSDAESLPASLVFSVVTPPTHGDLSGDVPDLTYTPDAGYHGPDSFTYQANDGEADSNIATVSITVIQVNAPPTADDLALDTDEDTPVALTLTGNDPDAWPQPLTFTVLIQPTHGTLTGTAPDLVYTPAPDYSGPDSFTYQANDGQADSNVATVDLSVRPVNDPPVADDLSLTTDQDTPATLGLTGSDAESLPASLVFSVVTPPTHGDLSGDAPDLTYTPDAGYHGPDSFTYQANDGEADSNIATVDITVNAAPSGALLYFNLEDNDVIGDGLSVANEDIVAFDGTDFSLYFDGSDVGLGGAAISAFSRISDTELLMSFRNRETVPGIGYTVDDSDIVKFTATSLGPDTAGSFSLYFDGSDVGLSRSDERIDALDLLPDGRLLISTTGNVSASGAYGRDEDLLAFNPSSLGSHTSGSFSLYFDGGDVGLGSSSEDVNGIAIDGAGKLYFSTRGDLGASGVNGDSEDVFVFTPTSLGSYTRGTIDPVPFFDGSQFGLSNNELRALDLPN